MLKLQETDEIKPYFVIIPRIFYLPKFLFFEMLVLHEQIDVLFF